MSLSAAHPCAVQDVGCAPRSPPITPNLDSSVRLSGCAEVAVVLKSAEEDRERCLAIAKAVADLYEVNGSAVRIPRVELNAFSGDRLRRGVCTSLKSERYSHPHRLCRHHRMRRQGQARFVECMHPMQCTSIPSWKLVESAKSSQVSTRFPVWLAYDIAPLSFCFPLSDSVLLPCAPCQQKCNLTFKIKGE